MKIIKANEDYLETRNVICPFCGSELEITDDDLDGDVLKCPVCKDEFHVDEDKDFSANPPKYPRDFFDFTNGVDVNNNKIQEWIDDCVNHLRNNKSDTYSFVSSGNTFVFSFKSEGDNEIVTIVAKKYSEGVSRLN